MDCVLKDLIDISKDGEWGKDEPFDDSVEMVCIRGTDFGDTRFGSLDSTPRRHVARRIADRKTLHAWDVLIEAAGGTKGQITGRTVLLRPQLFARSELPITCASFSRFIRFRTDLCDPEFMFRYLQYLYDAGFMHAYHTQHTGVARFQWTTFSEREPLHLPPLGVQRRIAGILSAYDDLIENNTRRIKILEEMARSIYREWFVHFRFPGHEKVKLGDSPLGKIPEGWEVKPIGEAIETLGGGTPSTKRPEYWEGGDVIWFTPSDLTQTGTMFISDSEKNITSLGLTESSARVFPPYSVMMTSRATIGVTAINTKAACTNQGFITCIPNERVSLYQIYFWVRRIWRKSSQWLPAQPTRKSVGQSFVNFPSLLLVRNSLGTS